MENLDKGEIQLKVEEVYDENLYESENESNEDLLVVDESRRKIIWQPKDFSIREFLTMKQDWDLSLQPDYQRNYVMNEKQASRLIESVLMDVPLPVIYLNEENDGSFSVIDWQQRLTSFLTFIEWKVFQTSRSFKLSGLKVLQELNWKSFVELSTPEQNKIKTTTLHTIVIRKESDDDIKFEIFERLNTWSIKLNEDEIRNTVYRWKYINLLKELENNEYFNKLVRKENYKNRMLYRGMILRFFALSEKSYINYKPSIKQFANKHIREFRNLSDEKVIELRDRFKNCVELVYTVFWENAFRRFVPWTSENPNGNWTTTRINMAIFDIQMCWFTNYTKNQIVPQADLIREEFMKLMCDNEKFISATLIETSNREQVHTRFKIWMTKLEEIIGIPVTEERIFPYSIKKYLFDQDSTCKLCSQQIISIDDSEVDHILPFSRWWKTNLENAQLTHRYCNRNKNNRT